jgi:Leucine-rich repeat (LRR) protein
VELSSTLTPAQKEQKKE